MLNLFVVAARFFLVFCVCPNFDDLVKQRRKFYGGFLRSEKTISLFIFDGSAFFSWFFFSAAIARDETTDPRHNRTPYNTTLIKIVR